MTTPAAQPTILIIDDEPDLRDLMRDVLAHQGCQVFCAANGPDGIVLNEQENPDVILLDLRMPGMDGITTLRN
ncbi:response regulator, partial [uncultured Lamprocystis sp.]|uniref:response regulator transcription factor n=1 Tax=uncultured Lamprocystis sp. TaxID=543132 RepID=UPI0025F9E8BC